MRTKALIRSGLLVVAALGLADAAAAPPGASCCLQSTSRLDGILHPISGGDEKFFTSSGRPANLLVMLDTSGSMQDWPQPWPTSAGCTHPQLTSLGYSASTVYPTMWQTVNVANTQWFDRNIYYNAPATGYGTNFTGAPTATTYATSALACAGAPNVAMCQSCLSSAGYYVGSGTYRRVTGNFLNFYAPRDSGAVHVLTQFLKDVRNVRFGLQVFNKNNNTGCAVGECGCPFEPMGPNCNFSDPLDPGFVDVQRNNILANLKSSLDWSGCGTPLASTLYLGGTSLASVSPLGIPASWTFYPGFQEGNAASAKAICFECGFTAMVLLTDGEPNGELFGLPPEITGLTVPACPAPCSTSDLPKVAKYFWTNDVRADLPGTQNIATYTIGFSVDASDSNLLRHTATQGGGQFYPARSSAELKAVFQQIIDDINGRNSSYSSANIASLQTGNEAQSAVLPRMKPSSGAPWTGSLTRFKLFNEFIEDMDIDLDAVGTSGYKTELFLLDANGARVGEDTQGEFVINGTTTRSTPYWEASQRLRANGHASRNIYTAVDTNGDGSLTDADGTLAFTRANVSTLLPYLGIAGAGQTYCPTIVGGVATTDGSLLAKWGMTLTAACAGATPPVNCANTVLGVTYPTTQAEGDQLCGEALIAYIRGQNLGAEVTTLTDGGVSSTRTDTRPSVLGDIFHSSPAMVEPPTEKFLCDLGISTQCVRTLYSSDGIVATPPTIYPEFDCGGAAVNRTAYESYANANRKRDRLVLVGANDGMVHAFNNGHASETCASGLSTITYDTGTGNEMWAFIPPDQISRLGEVALGHTYTLDADLMVRDIWADSATNPDKKDNAEFHTLVIAAEGRGGNHYVALEPTFNLTTGAATAPNFRWMYPQPCSREATQFGKTIYALAPKPPPIGPILMASSSATAVQRNSTGTAELWVTMVAGGWEPAMDKGRGVYMLDAWNGKVNGRADNLLWKAEYDPSAFGEQRAPLRYMHHSITAPVAMVDFSQFDAASSYGQDGFFDIAVVGDLAGQLWVTRMSKPGVIDAATKLINNFAIARGFEMDKHQPPGFDPSTKSYVNRWPFYYLTSIGLQAEQQAMRAFIGTGNRYSLLDANAGTCRYDNLASCAKYRCDSVWGEIGYLDPVTSGWNGFDYTYWLGQTFQYGGHVEPVFSAPTCGSAGGSPTLSKEVYTYIGSCPNPNAYQSFGYLQDRRGMCGQDLNGNFACTKTADYMTPNFSDVPLTPNKATLDTLGRNRFYGIWLYGGRVARTFDENAAVVVAGKQTATQFDTARLTDRGTAASATANTYGDLTDVTATTCSSPTSCTGNQAAEDGWGWFLEYENRTGWNQATQGPDLAHKTSSGAGLIASCTLFTSIFPQAASSGSCSNSAVARSRIHQGDYITGAPNCAAGFFNGTSYVRYQERGVVAPPPEPSMVIQISKTGRIRYSELLVEPGSGQLTQADVSGGTDVLQSVYELPVSKELHNCRHVAGGACVPNE